MSFMMLWSKISFFFFNDTATTEIYTLSLHDALPIFRVVYLEAYTDRETKIGLAFKCPIPEFWRRSRKQQRVPKTLRVVVDRKSTRLNSSHGYISYAVFCLKKKNNQHPHCHTLH